MKSIFSILFASILFFASAQSNDLKVDLEKSTVEWVGKKVTGQHNGKISLKAAKLAFQDSKLIAGLFILDMTTITCDDLDGGSAEKLVAHLKNHDFFNTDKFSEALLTIKEVTHIEGSSYTINADLEIKGIVKPISFSADLRENDATAVINVDRTLYDIKYGSSSFFDKLGDKAIDDMFKITVNLVY